MFWKQSKSYTVWRKMKQRCYDPKARGFSFYGGRGITVCQRWLDSFENFLADMGERPDGMSIDRINVNGNYEPGNCRWATNEQQSGNRRNTFLVTAFGETKCAGHWAHDPRCVVPGYSVLQRVKRLGWDGERAITTPAEVQKRQPLFDNAFYLEDDLTAMGYGPKWQEKARLAGVPVKPVGRRSGYFGDDLLAYIKTLDKQPV